MGDVSIPGPICPILSSCGLHTVTGTPIFFYSPLQDCFPKVSFDTRIRPIAPDSMQARLLPESRFCLVVQCSR